MVNWHYSEGNVQAHGKHDGVEAEDSEELMRLISLASETRCCQQLARGS